MPIQLQNHRTSNAKLFSASSNKQKLHTAASLQQTHKNHLKVRKNDSGTGFAMMTRMFANPTNATPNLPDALPERNCRQRRHSLGAAADASPPPPAKRDSTQSEGGGTLKKSIMRRTESLDAAYGYNIPHSHAHSQQQQQQQSSSIIIKRSSSIGRSSSSHNNNSSSSRDSSSERRRSSSNSRSKRSNNGSKGIRRSRSFGTTTPVIKSTAPPPPTQGTTRRVQRRRGSGDSAQTAPEAHLHAGSDHNGLVPPESPRGTLKAKREQMRRKSFGSTMGGMMIPIPKTPPSSLMNLLDDMSDPSESYHMDGDGLAGAVEESMDSLLSGSS